MKKLLVVIISLFITQTLIAQQKLDYSAVQLPEYLKSYYTHINLAEDYIAQENSKKVIKECDKALHYNPKPFGKDLINCFKVAAKNNNKVAFSYYKKLHTIYYNFDEIKTDTLYQSFFKKNEKKIKKIKRSSILYNHSYKLKLDTLYFNDQLYRTDYVANKLKIDSTDKSNAIILKKYIEEYGFPSEYEIGAYDETRSFLDFYLIIWHQLNGDSTIRKWYIESLKKAFIEGEINNINAFLLVSKLLDNPEFDLAITSFELNGKEDCCYIDKRYIDHNLTKSQKLDLEKINRVRESFSLRKTDAEVHHQLLLSKNKNSIIQAKKNTFQVSSIKDAEMMKKILVTKIPDDSIN